MAYNVNYIKSEVCHSKKNDISFKKVKEKWQILKKWHEFKIVIKHQLKHWIQFNKVTKIKKQK